MLKFKFGAWAVVLMLTAFSFSACDDNDDETYNPPANITEALKQLYPNAQNVEWEMKGDYYVADCWVTGDELDVWFDANANWVMTENELDSIDQLVPAVYTGFRNSNYSSWVVTDVFVLTYPQHPTESVIQVKQGNLRFALYFSQEGGCSHYITSVDNLWPVLLRWFPYTVRAGHVRFVSLPVPLCRKKHGAYRL